jgi:hypothetical protein
MNTVRRINRRSLRWLAQVGIAAAVLFSLAEAGVRIRVSRHDVGFTGASVLSFNAAELFGGVILQSKMTFVNGAGEPIAPNRVSIQSFDDTSNTLKLTDGTAEFSIRIEQQVFERMFSWIENNGTGVYTSARFLTLRQCAEYGMSTIPTQDIEHPDADIGLFTEGDYIATEFVDCPRLIAIAHALDFGLNWRRPGDEAAIRARCNAISASNRPLDSTGAGSTNAESDSDPTADDVYDPYDFDVDRDWVTSDLDSNFTMALTDQGTRISGNLYRYHRSARLDSKSTNAVTITSVDESRDLFEVAQMREPLAKLKVGFVELLPTAKTVSPKISSFSSLAWGEQAEDSDPEPREGALGSYALRYATPSHAQVIIDELRTLDSELKRMDAHCVAVEFARAAALLRTIHAHNRTSWDRFAEKYFKETRTVESR